MEPDSTTMPGGMEPFSGEAWFGRIEVGIRERVRGFIEELLEQELTRALGRAQMPDRIGVRPPAGGSATRNWSPIPTFAAENPASLPGMIAALESPLEWRWAMSLHTQAMAFA